MTGLVVRHRICHESCKAQLCSLYLTDSKKVVVPGCKTHPKTVVLPANVSETRRPFCALIPFHPQLYPSVGTRCFISASATSIIITLHRKIADVKIAVFQLMFAQ